MKRPVSRDHLVVGVTGGIGSGKSTVCAMFSKLGRTVISADNIARSLTESDEGVKAELKQEFSENIFDTKGRLDRSALAEIVFTNRAKLARLNRILHPRVRATLRETLLKLPPSRRVPYVVIEAALIFETGLDKELDATVVVDAPKSMRISRVMKRDGTSRRKVLGRIDSQMSAKEKVNLADFVIDNSGDPYDLIRHVEFLDRLFHLMARPSPSSSSG